MATKLIVKDLPKSAGLLEIRTLFEKFGTVVSIDLQPQATNLKASVEMQDAGSAQKAIMRLHNRPFMDHKIQVRQALLTTRRS